MIKSPTLFSHQVSIMLYLLRRLRGLWMILAEKNQGQVYLTISELSKKSNSQKLKTANKLHCQFGHVSLEKLKKLIKTTNINDQELLDIIDLVDQKCLFKI